MLYYKSKNMNEIDADTFFKELGNRIASFRNDLNITQIQLANKIGVSQQLVATYELGTRRMPIMTLFKLSQVLYVSIDELLGINKKGKPGPIPKIRRRLEQIQSLPQNKQKLVLDFLDSFIQMHSK